MSYAEFVELHAGGVAAMQAYFVEAEKTSEMLAGCKADPLPFADRLSLMTQEIAEREAHSIYLGIKHLLHDVARSGYGSPN